MHAGLKTLQCQPVTEMYIGNYRDTRGLNYCTQGRSSLFIRDGNAHNITTGTLKPPDLAYGCRRITGISTGH
jgi:hypothetical protein